MAKSFWDEEDFQQVNNGSFWDEQDFINTNRVAPQTVSTPIGTNTSSPTYPQVEQSPVTSQGTTFAEGMGRVGNAVSTGVGNFVDTVKANPMQFAKDSVNSFVVQPAKEFLGNVLNPDVKKSPWLALAGGIAKGAVELPQNIQNTVADIQDTYHGVEGMHNKWNYTDSIKDSVKSNPVTNLAYETVAEPMRNNEGLTTLAEFGGMGGAGITPVKAISKLDNMAKVANQTARITAKLDDAQKLKYAKQIDKLAKKRVAENAKTYINPALKEFNDNVLLGGALGALEGETLEERASNAVGGLATGAIAHGAVKGAGKAYNKAKPVVNEVIKGVSEADWVSKRIADIDNMLNTNISKNANELTQKRKEYRDLISKDTSLAKNLTEEQIKALEKADELSTQEQLELFERNLQGDKKYSYAEKKAERKQKAIEQQKAREVKEQQEAKEFFDNLLEEENASTAPVSEVSNPVDINTPKLEGTAVKTHELPAGKKVHINSNPKNKVGAEISKERYEELYGKDKKARQKELNEKWDLGREVTKEEFDQIKAKKKSYKEKVAIQRELAEQQGGFKPLEQPLSDISVSNATPSVAKNNRTIDKKGRVTVWNPDGTIKTRFKRTTKQQAVEKTREILDSEKAEGSDSSIWYEQKAKGEFGTNKLDKDNSLVGDYSEAQRLGMHEEAGARLEPTDTKSLQKEIDQWNEKDFKNKTRQLEEHLPDNENNKVQIDGITKRYLNTTGVYKLPADLNPKGKGKIIKKEVKLSTGETITRDSYIPKYKGLASKLRDRKTMPKAIKAIDALLRLEPSVEVRNTLTHLYKQSPNTIKQYIKQRVQEKGLNYNLDSNIELKSKKQIAREQKQVRTFMEDEPMKGISNAFDSDNFGIPIISKLYKGFKYRLDIAKASAKAMTIDKLSQKVEFFKEFKEDLKEFGDIKVAPMPHSMKTDTLTGKALHSIKTAFINMDLIRGDKIKFARTLAHELEHFKQEKLYNEYLKVPEDQRSQEMIDHIEAYKECLRVNEEKNNFYMDNADVLSSISSKLKGLSSVQKIDVINNLSRKERGIYERYKTLYNNYYNTKFEVQSREAGEKFAEKVVNSGKQTISMGQDRRLDATGLRGWDDRSGDVQTRTQTQSGLGETSVSRGFDSEEINFEGKMDEANAEAKSIQEEKVVKLIEDEFNQPTDTYSKFESKSAEVRGVQHHFKELNKRAEELYTKYDTYTPEQMRNRLRQQGGGDDAVYFKQGGQAQGKVSFGEQENTKVGFTGEKKYDGLKQKGSTSQSLAMQFNRDIRLNHVDKCIEFFKRNFDNQPKEGFVPVNTKLLFNTMAHGKSKAFYETLMKGEDAIREVFTNKAQADNWVSFAERIKANEADLYIPKDLFEMSITGEKELPLDYLKTYGRKIGINQIKAMGKIAGAMLDYYNDRFKRKVLTSASFFTNNRFGNQIMLMANASSPAEYFRSIKDAIKLKDSDIPTEILESTLAEAVWQETGGKVGNKLNPLKGIKDNLDGKHSTKRYFSENRNNAFDNLVRVLDGVMINTESLSGGKKLLAQGANIALAIPNAVFKEISNTMMGINAKAERFERKQAFAQTLNKIQKDKVTQTARKMATVKHLVEEIKSDSILRQTVIDKVADVLGDYNNFNKFEKNFMKRIIPFYAWNRTIVRHSIALCKDNPTKLALIALKTLELHTQDDGLEDYQHGALKTGIYDKTSGKNLVINKTKMIPYATLFDMIDTIRGKAPGGGLGQASPMIKKTWEAIKGEKQFKPSSEIQNKRYKRMSHKGQKGYLDTKTGEFKEGGLPAGARLAYVGKDALETVYPHIGSPLTKGVLSKDVIDHHNKTGEWRLPDKQYDASLGGFYDGDYIGSYNGKAKKRSAKMKMDLGHQVANRLTGLSLQPEQRKAQKEKWKKQSRKLRGY